MSLTHSELQIVPQSFYLQNTITVAQELIGTYLVHEIDNQVRIGKIVETEAYITNDPSNHAFIGQTKRNRSMFLCGGVAYIYRIYGRYFCFNVVTGKEGVGEAVLIRALEPVEGIEAMQQARRTTKPVDFCRGPSRLVIAMGITPDEDGYSLMQSPLYIMYGNQAIAPSEIKCAPRIGIRKAKDLPLRFYLKDSPFVSHVLTA